MAGTSLPAPAARRVTLAAVMVAASIGSLKVALTVEPIGTLVASSSGVRAVMVGGVLSTGAAP